MSPLRRWLSRPPASLLNGVSVALGIAALQLGLAPWLGHGIALAVSVGAICTSLADQPLAPFRNRRRTLSAAAEVVLATLVIGLLKPYPVVLGLALGLLSFVAAMALAWGPRAGPLSFVPILAFVFTMAMPLEDGLRGAALHAAWAALGAALYLAWAALTNRLLQPLYRRSALVSLLQTFAVLMRERAAALVQGPSPADRGLLAHGLADQARLDERLQAARDLIFAAPQDDETARRLAGLLLVVIDLRDSLLAGELDLGLVQNDADGRRLYARLAALVIALAAALSELAQALGDGRAPSVRLSRRVEAAVRRLAPSTERGADEPSVRLQGLFHRRAQHMLEDLVRLLRAADPAQVPPPLPLQPAELQLFVSPEGWPLAPLQAQLHLGSAVLRHALRVGVALSAAYFLGRWLPWASHPYWLVLSVAVVLRGNLEQTLSRLGARVGGTLAGCLLVLALSWLPWQGLPLLVFFVSVGLAHAFVTTRYVVTAGASTVMALMQVHLAHPQAGFPVPERMADTVIGAALAWAFCFVLPSWERSAVPRVVGRTLKALSALIEQTLRLPSAADTPEAAATAQRLARREAHEALNGVAMAAQRTRVEPQRVRLPLPELARLLLHGRALVAGLTGVRLMLARRGHDMPAEALQALLRAQSAALRRSLKSDPPAPTAVPAAFDAERDFAERDTLPPPTAGASPEVLLQWLTRRLLLLQHQVAELQAAAAALCPPRAPK